MPYETSLGELNRILAVRLDNIGDVIMLGPALRALKKNYPQAEITLMASPSGSQVTPMLPWVDELITWKASWQDISGAVNADPDRELALVETLRQRRFDAAFIFTSFSQSPWPPAYACYLAGIPLRVGHSKEFGGALLTHVGRPPVDAGHQVDRNLALLELCGLPDDGRYLELQIPDVAQLRADRLLLEYGIDPGSPFILVAPGASAAARRYDPDRFAQVTRILADQSGLPLVILGSEREAETISPVIEVARQASGERIVSLVGETDVQAAAALIRRAGLVLANNSASLHMADAFGRPMVILYSGTEYFTQWEPRCSPARLLRRETECSPCFVFRCPYNMECLDIAPSEVAAAALELLGGIVLKTNRTYAVQGETPTFGDSHLVGRPPCGTPTFSPTA